MNHIILVQFTTKIWNSPFYKFKILTDRNRRLYKIIGEYNNKNYYV